MYALTVVLLIPIVRHNLMTKVSCYLRTLRKEWEVTQDEVAFLMGKGDRNRVSDVERGKAQPNVREILTYALIFGFPGRDIFPAFYDELEAAVMRNAYELDQRLEDDTSPKALRTRKLLSEMLERATGKRANPLDL